MSLLDDLEHLDLSQIVNARGTLSASLSVEGNPGLKALLDGGAVSSVLGELSTSLDTLRKSADNPAALVSPLVDAVGELAEPLNLKNLNIDQYLKAVQEGAEILMRIFADFDGNPASLGKVFGSSLGDLFEKMGSTLTDVTHVDLNEATRFRELINLVESGVSVDPEAFADVAIDILLPFPKASLRTIRNSVEDLLKRADTVSLPKTRTAQLVVSLNAVADAAATGDLGAVNVALHELDSVRANTRAAIEADLQAVVHIVNELHIEDALQAVAGVSGTLKLAGDGILEFMARMRRDLESLRTGIDSVDPAQVIALIEHFVDVIEAQMRAEIGEAIDAQVERLKEWVRSLLRHLPLRKLRAELTHFIHAAAQAIIDADLDRYARDVHHLLDEVRSTVEANNLGDKVKAALGQVKDVVDGALNTIMSVMQKITDAINTVTQEAREVLQKVVDALRDFQNVINGITDAVNNLGVEAAAKQVVDTLDTLRQKAEALLSAAPLPEPMRPLVEQLIKSLEDVDLESVFTPVRAAVSELKIPDDVKPTITAALAKARDCLDNLIPKELIDSIQQEIENALKEFDKFDPASLLSGVTDYINEAAKLIESLDPTSHISAIRGPYQAVLDAFDEAQPLRLMAPVINAYDSLFGKINMPSPQDTAKNIGQAAGTVGGKLTQAAVEPMRQMAPTGMVDVVQTKTPQVTDAQLPALDGARPGDVVRMFGYLPNKLREALAGLEHGAAQEVLQTLDGLMGGLATSLRRVRDVVWEIDARLAGDLDEMLLPLGQAQLRAQLSLQASFSTSGVSFDLNGALDVVAQAGPGSMRLALANPINNARGSARAAARGTGGDLGATLDHIAALLDSIPVTHLLGSLDDFLAALDPEPLAAEVDAFVITIVNKTPAFFTAIETEVKALLERAKRLLEEFNPGTQAQKFLTVLDVLREELDLINPARLAAELGEIHAAIRETLVAYDPAVLAQSIVPILKAIADNLRSLDPANLLGDLDFFKDIKVRVLAASPANALQGIDHSLDDIGNQLAALDPGGLLDAVNGLGDKVLTAFEQAIQAIKDELIKLLKSLQFVASGASASVSVEASVG